MSTTAEKSNNGARRFNFQLPAPAGKHSTTVLAEQKSRGRNGIEILLYGALAARIFGQQLGVLQVSGLSGAIIVGSALVCLVVMLAQRATLPASLIFVLLITIIANLTDLMLAGLPATDLVYWMSVLLMVCYIVRDERAALRLQYFLALAVLISVAIGAEFVSQAQGLTRMALRGDVVGSMFANSNDLAQLALMTATALLFSSLRFQASTKILCWVGAVALSAIVLLTLSRQGLVMLGVGWVLFLLAYLAQQGSRLGLIVLAVLVLVAAGVYSDELAMIVSGYEHRMGLGSDRIAYWLTAPRDMLGTLFSGNGSANAISSAGIKPHSTFLWLHLAYGGLCAWIFVGWLLYLAFRTLRVLAGKRFEFPAKVEMFAFFGLFFLSQFTTVFAPGNYGYILGIALLEKGFSAAARQTADAPEPGTCVTAIARRA